MERPQPPLHVASRRCWGKASLPRCGIEFRIFLVQRIPPWMRWAVSVCCGIPFKSRSPPRLRTVKNVAICWNIRVSPTPKGTGCAMNHSSASADSGTWQRTISRKEFYLLFILWNALSNLTLNPLRLSPQWRSHSLRGWIPICSRWRKPRPPQFDNWVWHAGIIRLEFRSAALSRRRR